jgi:hypothetical protein
VRSGSKLRGLLCTCACDILCILARTRVCSERAHVCGRCHTRCNAKFQNPGAASQSWSLQEDCSEISSAIAGYILIGTKIQRHSCCENTVMLCHRYWLRLPGFVLASANKNLDDECLASKKPLHLGGGLRGGVRVNRPRPFGAR